MMEVEKKMESTIVISSEMDLRLRACEFRGIG